MKYNNTISEQKVRPRMKIQKIKNANFTKLLNSKQIGPNGRSQEWLELAQSEDLMAELDKKGPTEYLKKLKHKLASKGFYWELLK